MAFIGVRRQGLGTPASASKTPRSSSAQKFSPRSRTLGLPAGSASSSTAPSTSGNSNLGTPRGVSPKRLERRTSEAGAKQEVQQASSKDRRRADVQRQPTPLRRSLGESSTRSEGQLSTPRDRAVPSVPTAKSTPEARAADDRPVTARRPITMRQPTPIAPASTPASMPSTPVVRERSLPSSTAADEAAVRVVVRIRPRLKQEVNEAEGLGVDFTGQGVSLTNGRETKQFFVDWVCDSREPQEGSQAVFFSNLGSELVNHALKGYNVCVFAYGHTGSGKTYTMLGDGVAAVPNLHNEGAGFLPRFLSELFEAREKLPDGRNWRCTCEFLEVYNDAIRDLLSPAKSNEQRSRRVHVHPKYGVRVDKLSTSVVNSTEEALELVNFGNQLRTVSSTTMNERSSRSHAFFTFKYEQLGEEQPQKRRGPTDSSGAANECQSTTTFVDLAGREDRAASKNQSVQFREMCCINVSLFHLSHLITKISESSLERSSLSDFRNSKLTMLLAQALTGNSRTALVATLAPLQSFFEDSCSTMSFATSAKKIKTQPVVNKGTKSMVAELEAEVKRLQRELENQKAGNTEKDLELSTAQAMLLHYKKSWEEAMRGSEKVKEVREATRAKLGLVRTNDLPIDTKGCVLPFLTKLCDDPHLQGTCNYFLDRQEVNLGSSEELCDIVLQGLGIAEEMCAITRDPITNVVEVSLLETVDESVRVLVAGVMLTPEEPCMIMEHGDTIMLGYSHAFRLVKPTLEQTRGAQAVGSSGALSIVRMSQVNLDLTSVLHGEGESTLVDREIFPFVTSLTMRLPEDVVRTLLRDVGVIRPLIDEANLITKEILGHADMRFEMHALADVFHFISEKPHFVVCLVETQRNFKVRRAVGQLLTQRRFSFGQRDHIQGASQAESYVATKNALSHEMDLLDHVHFGEEDKRHLIGVLTVENFLERLNAIRDMYQEGSDMRDGFSAIRWRITVNPYANPWNQSSFQDMKMLTEVAASVRHSPVMTWLLNSNKAPEIPPRSRSKPEHGSGDAAAARAMGGANAEVPQPPAAEEVSPAPEVVPEAEPKAATAVKFPPDELLDESPKISKTSSRGRRSSRLIGPRPHCSSKSGISTTDLLTSAVHRSRSMTSFAQESSALKDHWRAMLDDTDFADVKLVPADVTEDSPPLLAHSVVLGRLPFFARLLKTATQPVYSTEAQRLTRELRVPDLQAKCLQRILIYAYMDSAVDATAGLQPSELEELAAAAKHCELADLQRACEEEKIAPGRRTSSCVSSCWASEFQLQRSRFASYSLTTQTEWDAHSQTSTPPPPVNARSQVALESPHSRDQQIAELTRQLEDQRAENAELMRKLASVTEDVDALGAASHTHEALQVCDQVAQDLRQALHLHGAELEALRMAAQGMPQEEISLQHLDADAPEGAPSADGPERTGNDGAFPGFPRAVTSWNGNGQQFVGNEEVVFDQLELQEALEAQKAQLAELRAVASTVPVSAPEDATAVDAEEDCADDMGPEVVWRPPRRCGDSASITSAGGASGTLDVAAPETFEEADNGQLEVLRADLLQQLKDEIQAELRGLAPPAPTTSTTEVAAAEVVAAEAAAAAAAANSATAAATAAERYAAHAAAAAATSSAHAATVTQGSGGDAPPANQNPTAVLSAVAGEVAELVHKLRSDLHKSMKAEIQDQLLHLNNPPPSPTRSPKRAVSDVPAEPVAFGLPVAASPSVAGSPMLQQYRTTTPVPVPVRSASAGNPGDWRRSFGSSCPTPTLLRQHSAYLGHAPVAMPAAGSNAGSLQLPVARIAGSGVSSPWGIASPPAVSSSGPPPLARPSPVAGGTIPTTYAVPMHVAAIPLGQSIAAGRPGQFHGGPIITGGMMGLGLSPRGPVPPIPPEPSHVAAMRSMQPGFLRHDADLLDTPSVTPPNHGMEPIGLQDLPPPVTRITKITSVRASPASSRPVSPVPGSRSTRALSPVSSIKAVPAAVTVSPAGGLRPASPVPGLRAISPPSTGRTLVGPFPRVTWEYYPAPE